MTRELRPDDPVTVLRGIGPRTEEKLVASGLQTLADLLFHLPRRYEDRRHPVDPGEVVEEGRVSTRGRVRDLRVRRLRGRRSLVEGTVEGTTGELPVVWFNQSYLKERLEGNELLLHGEVRRRNRRLVLTHPDWEEAPDTPGEEVGSIHPVYPGVTGVGSKRFGRWIRAAVTGLDLTRWFPETIPRKILVTRGLMPLPEALALLHDPPAEEVDLSLWNRHRTPAHRRLVYGELLGQQLTLARERSERDRRRKGRTYRIDDHTRELARQILPFRLTGAQKRVLRELVEDLGRERPMRRLLQGDVGSGKTIVAALLLMLALESGHQGVLLAPTEILAEQHFLALRNLFEDRYSVVLLSGARGSSEDRTSAANG
ncbi:MAG: DEAD/DEAH box helicase family protein, partial [Thermoanaerobaculia bacterium]|nr:DEAD/DEAH box helicase family protein [Thermoanaerobaculia bacterium]